MIKMTVYEDCIDFHYKYKKGWMIATIKFKREQLAADKIVYSDIWYIVSSKELRGGKLVPRPTRNSRGVDLASLELALHKVKLLLYKKGWDSLDLELPEILDV